jgi:hypothetical protein
MLLPRQYHLVQLDKNGRPEGLGLGLETKHNPHEILGIPDHLIDAGSYPRPIHIYGKGLGIDDDTLVISLPPQVEANLRPEETLVSLNQDDVESIQEPNGSPNNKLN